MKNKITAADIELRKSADRGGFTIWIAGECWGVAKPQHCGSSGMKHNLRYPSGSNIQDKQANGYRYPASVRSFHMRQLHRDTGAKGPTPLQPDAIKSYMADLINRGLVEEPKVRADRLQSQQEESRRAQAERDRKTEWMRDGLMSIAARTDLTDKESFAIKQAYRDVFYADMPAPAVTA